MQSLLMRDTLQDEYDLRREQRRELHELRMKFKRQVPRGSPLCTLSTAGHIPLLNLRELHRCAVVVSHLH